VSADQTQNPAPKETDQEPGQPRPDRLEHYFNRGQDPREPLLIRAWRGEIGLGWAFWGVGLMGTYPVFAVIFGIIGGLTIGGITGLIEVGLLGESRLTSFLHIRLVSTVTLVATFYMIPSTVIWRSAEKSPSKKLANLAQYYTGFGVFLPLIVFGGILAVDFRDRITPEFYENTPAFKNQAAENFKRLTTLDMPVGSQLAHTAYFRAGTLDYEFNFHIILDATNMDLKQWIETARPFDLKLIQTTPVADLEWSSNGLICDDLERPEAKYTKPICELVSNPRAVWHAAKRIKMDRVVTLTILEDPKLIWLSEASW
jgi:hypothetical protein